jgi:hypothetical protein
VEHVAPIGFAACDGKVNTMTPTMHKRNIENLRKFCPIAFVISLSFLSPDCANQIKT